MEESRSAPRRPSIVVGGMDVGTQTIRAAAVRWASGRAHALFCERRNVRLGQELKATGKIGDEALARAKDALAHMGALFQRSGVTRFRGVGTAVLRTAEDAERFLHAAARYLPSPLEVISQEEESALAMKGVLATLPRLAGAPFVVMDIGGGSTELLLKGPKAPPRLLAGLGLGAVTLLEEIRPSDPPSPGQWRAMLEAVEEALRHHDLPGGVPCVGVGGTAALLASLKLKTREYDPRRLRGLYITSDDLDSIQRILLGHTLEERRLLPGMEPERADISVAGLAICVTLLRHLAVDGFLVSDGGLLMGLVMDLMEKELNTHVKPSCTAGLYL